MAYAHDTNTADGTATVPTGKFLRCYSCVAGDSGGTITITEAGAEAADTITVPAGESFGDTLELDRGTSQLGPGSTVAFAGMASWFVGYR